VRVPLTDSLLEEVRQFSLRSSCQHCLYFLEDSERCLHEWPNDEQKRWPLDAPDANGERPATMSLCKEFELK